MALTNTARDKLGAKVVGHEDLAAAVNLPTGLRKTSRGLIAPVSKSVGDTRSGSLAEDPAQESVTQEPESRIVYETPRKTRRGKGSKQEQPALVTVNVVVEGFGKIPAQYQHVYTGEGVVVLGLTNLSFVPQVATTDGTGGLTHMVSFEHLPDRQFVYCGNSFIDNKGVNNVILIEVKNG